MIVKKGSKNTKRASILSDSSDEDWQPIKTRSSKKKSVKKDKITPQKKAVYNTLSNSKNSKSTCKRSKTKSESNQKYPTPSEFIAQ